ncbi:hypothetical protein GCM10027347_61570 [Larkinella harenae]
MIIIDKAFKELATWQLKKPFNDQNLKIEMVKTLIAQLSDYLVFTKRVIVPDEVEKRQGIEVSMGFVALNRKDYKQVKELLSDLAGGNLENETYQKIIAILEQPMK